jgi:hypothetical protein
MVYLHNCAEYTPLYRHNSAIIAFKADEIRFSSCFLLISGGPSRATLLISFAGPDQPATAAPASLVRIRPLHHRGGPAAAPIYCFIPVLRPSTWRTEVPVGAKMG